MTESRNSIVELNITRSSLADGALILSRQRQQLDSLEVSLNSLR